MSSQYRKQGNSLYQLRNGSYIHCANIPARIKTLAAAIRWYEAEQ